MSQFVGHAVQLAKLLDEYILYSFSANEITFYPR